MVLFYWGADGFRSHEHVVRTIESFREKRDPQGYNVFVFDVNDAKSAEIWEAISSAPFMAEKKMVVVKHLFSVKSEFEDELRERLASLDSREDLVLLLHSEGDKFRNSLFKDVMKLKYAQEFIPLKAPEIMGWIAERLDGHGVTIESNASSLLAKSYTEDMWSLSRLVDQLVAFVKSESRAIVTKADCEVFLPEVIDDNTFHFVDAINAKDHGRALSLLDQQWQSGKTPIEVIGLLLWQWRVMLKVRALLDEQPKLRGKEIAKELKLHAFVADKTARLVRDVDVNHVLGQYNQLMRLDESAKSGGYAQAELTSLVTTLTCQ
ncbi:MAG: DNA polymerase III subunit delta [Parcubacteria group bacterium]|nr:DNA polymerase III subunit delta [Parcubacteria group bacterium]|tara:strand:+ start:1714 stop:2676 length:963 start_codon:yes stop_codon:yes gene_type:complete